MALKVYEESNISAIADKIREKTSGTTKYTTEEMPDGVAEVYEAGGKASLRELWNKLQSGGWNTNYAASLGAMWTAETFKPEYDMKIVTGAYAFAFNRLGGDLVELFERLGRKLDLTQAANVGNMFQASQFTRIGNFCCPAGGWWNTFNGCVYLETIDEWGRLTEDEEITGGGLVGCFTGCTALKNIKVRGKIAENINFQWCPLSYDSIVSIISHLSDTATGQTLTLSKAAVDKAFATGTATYRFNDDNSMLDNINAEQSIVLYDFDFESNQNNHYTFEFNYPTINYWRYGEIGPTGDPIGTLVYDGEWVSDEYKTITVGDSSMIPLEFAQVLVKTAKRVSENTSTRNDGSTSAEWLAWVASKPNWTISLI